MTMTNDQRVAEILARGVTRLRAMRIATNDAAKDQHEPHLVGESLGGRCEDKRQNANNDHEEASR